MLKNLGLALLMATIKPRLEKLEAFKTKIRVVILKLG
jgi:hypothetical protein